MQLCHISDNSSTVTKLHFQSTQRTSTLRVGPCSGRAGHCQVKIGVITVGLSCQVKIGVITLGLSCQIKIGVITVGLSYCGS